MQPFTDLIHAILNEFIAGLKCMSATRKVQDTQSNTSAYFNYTGRFENEVMQLAEPAEQEIQQMREEIKKKKNCAYPRQYLREYRVRNLEKQREYERIKVREYQTRRKAQTVAAQPAL